MANRRWLDDGLHVEVVARVVLVMGASELFKFWSHFGFNFAMIDSIHRFSCWELDVRW